MAIKKRNKLRHSVVSVGDNCIDRYVEPVNQDFVGGNAVNVAIAIKRKGILVSYIGAVGTDLEGRWILSELREEGIDVSRVKVIEGTTAFTDVALQDGERILLKEDFGVGSKLALTADDIEFISSNKLIYNTILGRTEAFIPAFKVNGATIAFDYSDERIEDIVDSWYFHYIDIGFVSMPEADIDIAKKYSRYLVEKGLRLAVITMGVNGSLVCDGNKIWVQPAIKTKHLVDTLGAGDSFIGAFLAEWLNGSPINFALKEGAIEASKTCEHLGAWVPSHERS